MDSEIVNIAASFESQVKAQGKNEHDLEGAYVTLKAKDVYYMLTILLNPGNWYNKEEAWGEDRIWGKK